jgi:hypothetical protein
MSDYVISVTGLTSLPSYDGYTNVVYRIFWRVWAARNAFQGTHDDFTDVKFKKDEPFTPYNELTEAMVLSWVSSDAIDAAKADVDAQIAAELNPYGQVLPLPWAN